MSLSHYKKRLDFYHMPEFMLKYLGVPSLVRLDRVGYFCGMDYASKSVYNFSEKITRYDHSLTTALLAYSLTEDKLTTIRALFHDVSTPAFSHVIDYMNKDYSTQESTEEYTEKTILGDDEALKCFRKDGINPEDIIRYKDDSIVDLPRPSLCADRLDGIILTGMGWTKEVDNEIIDEILNDITIYKNEDGVDEIGFKSEDIAWLTLNISNNIDIVCHSNEDNYMMDLLSKITKLAISNYLISYDSLYILDDETLFRMLERCDGTIKELLTTFKTVDARNIPKTDLGNIKQRILKPIVGNKRIS